MRALQDALLRPLEVAEVPARIVSLVPSVTELLYELGAGERVVAVSSYCSEPEEPLRRLKRIGGQKDPDVAGILALAPDLVIAVKEENLRKDVEAIAAAGVPVYVAEVRTLEDALALIGEIGELCAGDPPRIDALRERVAAGIAGARRGAPSPPVPVFCPVWRDPWITISDDTYCAEVLRACGARAILAGRPKLDGRRYPKVTLDEVRAARPRAILLPDEPYPFGAGDAAELASIAPVILLDGKLLTWYGGRTARIGELARALGSLSSGRATTDT